MDGISGEASYTYDAAGNMETATDQRNLTTSYIHNGFGEVIQQVSPDTGVTEYRYDAAGNRTYRMDARLVEASWTYDALGRPLTMAFLPLSPAEDVTYIYDDATPGNYGIGRLASVADGSGSTAYTYDADGSVVRVESVIGAQTYVTQYAYDASNQLASMTYPSGRIIDYTYDTLGRVDSVATRANELATPVTLASGLTYQPFGGLDGFTYGNNATLALGHDLDGRMTAMDALDATAAPILDLDYGFDLAGNIEAVTDVAATGRGCNYIYDALYRLTDASGDIPTESYGYDLVGNRQTRNADSYAYAALSNQLDSATEAGATRLLGYSASGNIATDDREAAANWTFTYDSTDRLTQVDEGVVTLATYLHNPGGQRIAKTVGAATTHYLYDLGGNLIGEADGTTGTAQAEYVWLGGVPLAYITGGSVYYVHPDHLTTPQRVTDAGGAVVWDASYSPFGEATVTGALTFNLRFPGQYLDAETGLHYNGFRDYDPTTGRYIQSDPIGLDGGLNTYGYAGGMPTKYTDSMGLKIDYLDPRLIPNKDLILTTEAGKKLWKILEESPISVNIYGSNDHCKNRTEIYDANGDLLDEDGPAIARYDVYAYLGDHSRPDDLLLLPGEKNGEPIKFPLTTTRTLAHELGHAAGARDDGGFFLTFLWGENDYNMNNVNMWENPIMIPLDGIRRTAYEPIHLGYGSTCECVGRLQ